jgi:hypothetical protein
VLFLCQPAGASTGARDVNNPYANDNAGASASNGGGGFNDLPIAQRKIMEHIAFLSQKGALAEEGINIHQLAREASGGKLSLEQVRAEVNAMVDEGHLYATIDDDQ